MKMVILVLESKELALEPWAVDWQQQHGRSRTVEKPFTGLSTVIRLPTLSFRAYLLGQEGFREQHRDYQKLKVTLNEYGVPSVIAKVSRFDWFRNAAGLVDPNYWRGTLRLGLFLIGGTLSLIGHSAGGWLARVYMEEFGLSDVSLLLTLGTPHLPPPKGVPGVIDQTRGLLDYVEKHCAKAIYTPHLKYVCIAGRYIQGARFVGNSNAEVNSVVAMGSDQPNAEAVLMNDTSTSASIAINFVPVLLGKDVWGDGVVPEASAHLEGALNISLEGVYHSPVGSDDELRPWYGSPAVVDQWIHHLLN
ncbi:hypothetical protein GH714_021473 [Hevea brasiliensis]|uniref:GPI inositol-deacylase n=1 Tax=Hevea brasiliensis TaxID=3981 RepID=A0A6A6M0I5_HEVBR|nr:hypothetical protein GH714_021473 [Hevea brasiliensis]